LRGGVPGEGGGSKTATSSFSPTTGKINGGVPGEYGRYCRVEEPADAAVVPPSGIIALSETHRCLLCRALLGILGKAPMLGNPPRPPPREAWLDVAVTAAGAAAFLLLALPLSCSRFCCRKGTSSSEAAAADEEEAPPPRSFTIIARKCLILLVFLVVCVLLRASLGRTDVEASTASCRLASRVAASFASISYRLQ